MKVQKLDLSVEIKLQDSTSLPIEPIRKANIEDLKSWIFCVVFRKECETKSCQIPKRKIYHSS